MRPIVVILAVVLAGCQAGPATLDTHGVEHATVMSSWALYRACMTERNFNSVRALAVQFSSLALQKIEPPAWMASFGVHVSGQPLRVTVDPRALGAACSLRAARLAADAQRFSEADTCYREILDRYDERDYAYYVDQARQGLTDLQSRAAALLAFTSLNPR
jgi:hypothetical protein